MIGWHDAGMRTLPLVAATAALLLAGCSSGASLSAPTSDHTGVTTPDTSPDTTADDSTPGTTEAPTTTTSPTDTHNDGRYTDLVFDDVTVDNDLVYATAPDLGSGADATLHLDVYQPKGDTLAARPTIVWVHGGGFKLGTKESLREVATDWARRGYVTVSVEYRLDPGNRCQDVQDLKIDEAGGLSAERERCMAAIDAAQHDTQAAIRWLRAHADEFAIDPDLIAIGGFSAGAVTAVNVATQADDPGDVGDDLDQSSDVAAALVASGCSFDPEAISSDDAPMYLIASENDQAVPFLCTKATEKLATARGVDVQTDYHMGEGTHAKSLYTKYQAEVDEAWAAFLVDQLGLD
jgi:dienelactone hydrolase